MTSLGPLSVTTMPVVPPMPPTNVQRTAPSAPPMLGDSIAPPGQSRQRLLTPPSSGMWEFGTIAAQGQHEMTRAVIEQQPDNADPRREHFKFWLVPLDSNTRISSYDIEMEKPAHVIIVSDDFKTFRHDHPTLNPDGTFTLDQSFDRPGKYYIYFDTVPHSIGQQVFRFDVAVGGTKFYPYTPMQRLGADAGLEQSDGSFMVALDSDKIKTGVYSPIHLAIYSHGELAEHLQPFLGVGAHAILLKPDDLSYIHTHPMPGSMAMAMPMSEMMKHMPTLQPGDPVNPRMTLDILAQEPGAYRMWVQFKDRDNPHYLYTVPFTVYAT